MESFGGSWLQYSINCLFFNIFVLFMLLLSSLFREISGRLIIWGEGRLPAWGGAGYVKLTVKQ